MEFKGGGKFTLGPSQVSPKGGLTMDLPGVDTCTYHIQFMYIKIQNKAIDKGLTKINFKIFFWGKQMKPTSILIWTNRVYLFLFFVGTYMLCIRFLKSIQGQITVKLITMYLVCIEQKIITHPFYLMLSSMIQNCIIKCLVQKEISKVLFKFCTL